MEKGLALGAVIERRKQYGKNELVIEKRRTTLKLFYSQFLTFLNGVLFAAAIISFFISHALDGLFIITVIILNSVLGFIQEYRAEKSIEKLKNYTIPIVRVRRDGKEQQVSSLELVPEDIVIISEGDRIPADCVLLESNRLEVDEAILTGESLPVLKNDGDSIFSGTLVIKGKAVAKVTAIGMKTKLGQIAQTLQEIKIEETPLQKNLSSLGKRLTVAIIAISLLIIPIGLYYQEDLFQITLTAVSIAVAAIPQGLPAVITVALALGTSRMAKRKAIVRTMSSVETLGSVQIVLVDKTGTLTENKMRVKESWIPDKESLRDVLYTSILGNTASLVKKADSEKFDIVGDKTDGALLLWAEEQKKEIGIELGQGKIVDEHVFDPKTRMITTVWEHNGRKHVYVRGAPEAVLAKSTAGKKLQDEAVKKYEELAGKGLRVIALASKIDNDAHRRKRHELESELEFLGIIGIYDPPREEVKKAVESARHAGIKTIMVTGDNELTALAIAKEIGLVEKDEDVITGDELEKLTDAELKEVLMKTSIFARSKPQDKLRLTSVLKEQGFVVGVTGDGVNDALALKKADVGVAMGETGTDVAKEASDIIVVDDNFKTLVYAIEEGRTIYRNIATAITYLLTGNLSEIALVFCATLLGMPAVLLPTQILWINIVTDVLPAMALASDERHPDILKNKPRDPKQSILTKRRLIFIGVVGLGLAFVLLGIFSTLLISFSENHARAIVFNLLILSHMALAFIVRRQSLLSINKPLVASVVFIVVLQIIISTQPFFQEVFGLVD